MNDLSEVKVGDEVFYYQGSGIPKIVKVEKVHKLHVIVAGTKFKKYNGCQVGESWSRWHIKPITPENQEQVKDIKREFERQQLINSFRDIQWSDYSTEVLKVLEAVKAVLGGVKA